MSQHEIITPRGNNIGANIIAYLTNKGIYGKVEILTIDTKRNVKQRVNKTLIAVIPKLN